MGWYRRQLLVLNLSGGGAPGTGDVVGPASSVDGRPALFDGTTGKLLKQASAALGTAAFAATTNFLAAAGTAADVNPAGTSIAAALAGKLSTSGTAADVNPAGTSIAAALAGKQAAGSYVTSGGALGTPSSGTLTNCTGLPEAGLSLTDITTANASTTAHGLALKVTAAAAGTRNVHCVDNGETARKDAALFDTTNPEALGTVGPGTSLIAARRDHVHPRQTAITEAEQTLADNTTNDVSTTKHGYAPKAPNDATKFLNGTGAYSVPAGGSLVIKWITTQGGSFQFTNMPAAVTFLGYVNRLNSKIDLTNYTQCRFTGKQPVAAASGAKLILRYKTTSDSNTATDFSDIGTSEVSVTLSTSTATTFDSGWISLVAGAKADVWVTIVGSGGDGAADPDFGDILVHFK